MAANLIEMMQSSLAPTLIREASHFLGESESATQSAVGAALPALLGGLMQKASSAQGASSLFELLSGPTVDARAMSNLGSSLSGGDQANSLLKPALDSCRLCSAARLGRSSRRSARSLG